MSTSSTPPLTAEQIQATREIFNLKGFRILVIGRANAGKTTILRTVCNMATGEPMILDPRGKKIESSNLDPSLKRGEHNIENQMIFKGNPGFIFHDSRGFEAGGDQELKLVQQFLQQRSKARNVNEQLHAIWYCIPTSDDRPITAAEKKFFNECGTGLVPVIVLWTKTEALDLAKIKQLMNEGNSKSDAMQQAPKKAWADFEGNVYPRFAEFKYQPKAYVVFRKMHEPGGDCNELINKTAKALSSEELQQFFVSTQQNNISLCVEYGIQGMMIKTGTHGLKYFKKNKGNWACFMAMVLEYFPQHWIDDVDLGFGVDFIVDAKKKKGLDGNFGGLLDNNVLFYRKDWESVNMNSISDTMPSLLSGLSTKFNLMDATYCAIAAAIIGYLGFFLKEESPRDKHILKQALQVYEQSASHSSIKQAVEHLFEDYYIEDSHDKYGIFTFSKHCYGDVEDKLVRGAIQIALDNCLSMK